MTIKNNDRNAIMKRNLKARNGLSTDADDKYLIKRLPFDILSILRDNSDDAKRGEEEAINCSIHYEQFVGKNLTPIAEIEKAYRYILSEASLIKKARDISIIDTHLGHIEYGAIAIDHRISGWLNGFSMDYKSPYEVHSLEDFLKGKPLQLCDKKKAIRKECNNLIFVAKRGLQETQKPTQKGLFTANCDLFYCERSLHFLRTYK